VTTTSPLPPQIPTTARVEIDGDGRVNYILTTEAGERATPLVTIYTETLKRLADEIAATQPAEIKHPNDGKFPCPGGNSVEYSVMANGNLVQIAADYGCNYWLRREDGADADVVDLLTGL